VDEKGAEALRFFGEYAWSLSIDGGCGFPVGLGAIDGGVGGGVEDDVWLDGTNDAANLSRIGEVELAAIATDDFTVASESAHKLAPDLTSHAGYQNAAQSARSRSAQAKTSAV
jgi:hypothetical protein